LVRGFRQATSRPAIVAPIAPRCNTRSPSSQTRPNQSAQTHAPQHVTKTPRNRPRAPIAVNRNRAHRVTPSAMPCKGPQKGPRRDHTPNAKSTSQFHKRFPINLPAMRIYPPPELQGGSFRLIPEVPDVCFT
jgi:hypothetical protein